jgi:hypothetical protein
MSLKRLLREVRACRICEAELPLGPRPVVQLASAVRLLIVGQAPGSKVHRSGIPWNDASGDRLHDWLGLDRATFFDEAKVATWRRKTGGDNPPLPECAPRWHERLLRHLPSLQLTLFGRSTRSPILFGGRAGDLHDRDRQSFFTARSPILPVAASKLAQRYLDAKKTRGSKKR